MSTQIGKRVAVFYHKADLDGIMSAVVANYYLSARVDKVDLIPADYGEDCVQLLMEVAAKNNISTENYHDIYVIDFSDAILFNTYSNKIIWIDHHGPTFKEMPRVRDAYLIDGVAACRLAFDYLTFGPNYAFHDKDFFFNRRNEFEPWVVTLAGEYDIWDKTSPLGERFNFGCELTFEAVDYLFRQTKNIHRPHLKSFDPAELKSNKSISKDGENYEFINHIVSKGEGVLAFIKQTGTRVKPVHIDIKNDDGWSFHGVSFNTHIKSSLIYQLQANEDFIMVYNYEGGDCVKASFYSDKGVDCSVFAKRYGGGGHKGAAGCRMHLADLAKLLQVKTN